MSAIGRVSAQETLVEEPDHRMPDSAPLMELPAGEQSLVPYLRLFWNHRQFLFRVGVYAVAASVLLAFVMPVRYRSVTRLMPPDSQSSSGMGLLAAMAGRGGTAGLAGLAGDLLGVKSSGELFVGILASESVQDRLIEEFQLQRIYHDSKIEDARRHLSQRTDVSEDRKSGIISISVTDHDPKRAAAMAQAYVNELDRLVAQVSTSSARRERLFLEDRLQKVKVDLNSAAVRFSDFASKNTAIDIPAQGKAMVEAAATLQGQLIAAQAELSGLQQIYTNSNVRVRTAEARVNELQKKLNEIGGAGPSGETKEGNTLYPSIRRLPILGVTYADLYRQTKIEETVYELLTQQYELAKVQEAKEIPTVKVLDPARVPTKRSFPPRAVVVILGTILGFAMAMTWVVGRERWAAVDATDPRKELALEVFTTLQARVPRLSWNGTGNGSNGHGLWAFRKASENNPKSKDETR